MKKTKTKLLCLLLAALMLLSLTACGKNKESTDKALADSNLLKLGDYELLYKGACIMEDSDGNDAVVLTLDFTTTARTVILISGRSPKQPCRTVWSWRLPSSIPIRTPMMLR